jgi:hypothetical protein
MKVAPIGLAALCACHASEASEPGRPRFLLGGIQVNEDDHWYWVRTIDRIGMNTVAATVYTRQADWDSARLDLYKSKDHPHEATAVISEIREAARSGVSVVLVLRVALDHAHPRNRFLWHGMIMPKDDEAIAEWFHRYEAFVVAWARIAESEGVAILAIGSEMSALASTTPIVELPPLEAYYLSNEKQHELARAAQRLAPKAAPRVIEEAGGNPYWTLPELVSNRSEIHRAWAEQVAFAGTPDALDRWNRRAALLDRKWRDLIRAVRKVYTGRITYAANFDQYARVGFWDDLDWIGINAYFPLRALDDRAAPATFTERWRRTFAEIDAMRRERGLTDRQVLFTEIGYTRRRDSTVEPWSGGGLSFVPSQQGRLDLLIFGDRPQDRGERAAAIEALGRASAEHPGLLAGALYWKLSTRPEHETIEPFALIIGEDARDPLQERLLDLADPRATRR